MDHLAKYMGQQQRPRRHRLHQHVHAELPPAEPPGAQARRLHFVLQLSNCEGYQRQYPWAEQLQEFLRRMQFSTANDSRHGCTWLELFILYHLAGYNMDSQEDSTSPIAKPTLAHRLKELRLATRRMAKTMMAEEDIKMFKGTPGRSQRLRGYGINTLLAIMPFCVHLTPGAREQLAIQVLRSQRRIPVQEAQQIMRKRVPILLKAVQTRGRVKWLSMLKPWERGKIFVGETTTTSASSSTTPSTSSSTSTPGTTTATSSAAMAHNGAIAAAAREASRHQPNRGDTYLQCPRCTNAVNANRRKAFDHTKLDSKTWCKDCKRSLPVKQWTCICGIPWHTCSRHGTPHAAVTTVRRTNVLVPSDPIRRLDNPSHQIDEWLDSKASKRPKPNDVIDLGEHFLVPTVRTHMLGPRLKRKFQHLDQEVQE